MTTLQEYLNNQYPTPQEKKQAKEIIINDPRKYKDLIGNQLNLSSYPNLETVMINGQYLQSPLTELNLSNCAKLVKLICSYNQITNLNLTNCINLKALYCPNNQFSNLNFLNSLNSEGLTKLVIYNNNLTGDLNPLRKLVNLEYLDSSNNPLYGSLEPFQGMVKLWKLDIRNTDLDSGLEYLSESVSDFRCSGNLYNLFANEQGEVETDKNRGIKNFPQKLQEYKQKSQVEIRKLIKGQKRLEWIPYEQFADIEYLAEGGFSKIYKAKRERGIWHLIVLKSLNNSQNTTLEFLTEITNTNSATGGNIVYCHGISWDPVAKNYVMIMPYIEEGNLREHLQKKTGRLNLEDKFGKLLGIAHGLNNIHQKNLIHRDLHSGNILGDCITDLGLCRPVNEADQEKVYGVLPYVAPEVLQGQSYTQASDIYSFGIIAFELLANSHPYSEYGYDSILALRICEGLRPNLREIEIPRLLKVLIRGCWNADPLKRPSAEKVNETINNWLNEIQGKKDTEFCRQYRILEAEYNFFSQNIPYRMNPTTIAHSKPINTKQITELLTQFQSLDLDIDSFANTLNLDELNIQENHQGQGSNQARILHQPFGIPGSSKNN